MVIRNPETGREFFLYLETCKEFKVLIHTSNVDSSIQVVFTLNNRKELVIKGWSKIEEDNIPVYLSYYGMTTSICFENLVEVDELGFLKFFKPGNKNDTDIYPFINTLNIEISDKGIEYHEINNVYGCNTTFSLEDNQDEVNDVILNLIDQLDGMYPGCCVKDITSPLPLELYYNQEKVKSLNLITSTFRFNMNTFYKHIEKCRNYKYKTLCENGFAFLFVKNIFNSDSLFYKRIDDYYALLKDKKFSDLDEDFQDILYQCNKDNYGLYLNFFFKYNFSKLDIDLLKKYFKKGINNSLFNLFSIIYSCCPDSTNTWILYKIKKLKEAGKVSNNDISTVIKKIKDLESPEYIKTALTEAKNFNELHGLLDALLKRIKKEKINRFISSCYFDDYREECNLPKNILGYKIRKINSSMDFNDGELDTICERGEIGKDEIVFKCVDDKDRCAVSVFFIIVNAKSCEIEYIYYWSYDGSVPENIFNKVEQEIKEKYINMFHYLYLVNHDVI